MTDKASTNIKTKNDSFVNTTASQLKNINTNALMFLIFGIINLQ
ncbi:hypothetical protein BH11BAC6_BH11BAC6_13530 [soil metagenome]